MSTDTLSSETLLTSHQAGSLLQVNPSSINKWVEQGHIEAFRTPGGHRRIRASDLVRFLRAHDMPVPAELSRVGVLRVLLVDDEQDQLVSWRRALRVVADQIDLRTADNGIEALLTVGSFRPHVVVLDIFMPGIDGIEACRRLSENPRTRGIRILVTSGRLDEKLEKRALEAGALQCLRKPIRLAELLEAIGIRPPALAPAAP
jgi:excisionase family DNA binding protein